MRLGIVGVGNIGTAHAAAVYGGEIEGLELTALCDIDPVRRAWCRERFPGVNVREEYGRMLEDVDAVVVSVPHKYHADLAMEALKRGKHVLVEKPEDVSVTKAAALNRVAEASGKVFMIMFNQRTNPLYIRAWELVRGGELGALKRTSWTITNWYRTQAYYDSGAWRATWDGEGGGVLLNQAPHNLDLWQWICGMPTEVTAFCDVGKYHRIEVEDDVTVFVRYPNGATGTFITSTGEFPGTNRLEIAGEKGKLVIENGVLKRWSLPVGEREICFGGNPDDVTVGYEEYRAEDEGEAHRGILRNFSEAMRGRAERISPGEEGIRELSLSNAAYLSAWKGNVAVSLPVDGEEFDRLLAERQRAAGKSAGGGEVKGEYLKRWQTNW